MTNYKAMTEAELKFTRQDAYEAAQCARAIGDVVNELRYLDQVNDASTELFKRTKGTI
jgi:hypothetical protein